MPLNLLNLVFRENINSCALSIMSCSLQRRASGLLGPNRVVRDSVHQKVKTSVDNTRIVFLLVLVI
jgi:hypothetical protein